MIKILFLIHDLGQGGAEKVLVNLVNNMDRTKFDISLIAMFGGGVNEQFLKKDIKYKALFPRMIPGNSKLMKLFTPEQLHKWFIKEEYDIEVSYLEGPSARVISGCRNPKTKLVSWIHSTPQSEMELAASFRNLDEAKRCYAHLNKIVCVSKGIKAAFCKILELSEKTEVLYNTVESMQIKNLAKQPVKELEKISTDGCRIICVGTLKAIKGYDRLLNIVLRLKEEGYHFHLYILGVGPLEKEIKEFISQYELKEYVTLLGYQVNPYKYMDKADLLVCASRSEGFSTVVTESMILGTPVCTVDVSGMKEILGDNNEYGYITPNNENALYNGLKKLLDDSGLIEEYRKKALVRGMAFSTEETVLSVEKFLINLLGE